MYKFSAKQEAENLIIWIKNWYEYKSGNAKGLLVAISGGADSTFIAKICCEAVGNNNVFGLLMPNGIQSDINDSYEVCDFLNIKYKEINIKDIYTNITMIDDFSSHVKTNIPPGIRFILQKTIAQQMNYRIVGTLNLSEKTIGYTTKGTDNGDINPNINFTKTEIIQMGDYLNLPFHLVHKIPSDGLSGLSDEENMKITYKVLDNWIRTKTFKEEDKEMIERIIKMNEYAQHKINPIPFYNGGNYD